MIIALGHVFATASYIPIIYGCNKTCTYCIVPFRRGKERSRTIEDVAREVETLAAQGVREGRWILQR